MVVLVGAVALVLLLVVLGVLNASGFFRALPLLLLLGGLSFLTFMIVRANLGPAWAGTAALLARSRCWAGPHGDLQRRLPSSG